MFDSLKNLNKLRQQAKKIQNALGEEVLIGPAEDGKIQITMDGNQEVKAVRIEPDLLTSENKEKIEKGIKEAITQCVTQMQMAMARKMRNGGF